MNSITRASRRPLWAAIAIVFSAGTASAATITVTTGGDAGTATTCTLRQAIDAANNDNAGTSSCIAGSGTDTIVFANALVNSTITLTQGQLAITTPLTIVGSNETIDAAYQSRILQVTSTLSASNLKLQHGYPHTPATGYQGGAILAFSSAVTLSNVVMDHNKVASYGGAIQVNHTTLDMTDVTLSNNKSTGTHGSFLTGGGLNVNGDCTVTLMRTTITGNSANDGAAMYVDASTSLKVTDSTISGNTAGSFGGALVTGDSGIVSFIDSTISGNTATIGGGGLIINPPNTTLYMANVTMTGNDSGYGGALLIDGSTQSTLINVTISQNGATTNGGGIWMSGGTVDMANTILAGNTSGVASTADLQKGGGTLTAQYSLLGTPLNTNPYNDAGNHNLFSNALGLSALANNGGNVQTMALLVGSPR